MTSRNGHLNGSGKGDNDNVASLDDARIRAAQKAKAEQRARSGRGRNSTRDWIFASMIVLMALGYVAYLVTGWGHK